jgi:hypothetical protein
MRRLLLLLSLLSTILPLRAELSPSAYEAMQKAAPELLSIEILRVEVSPGDVPGRQNIHIMALVNKVARSGTSVKAGDLINLFYSVTPREKGRVGPGETPILEEKEKTLAYLAKDPTTDEYHPAAGAMSFRNF